MSYIRYTFWGVVTLVLVVVGLANRTPTRVNAMPDELAEFLGLAPTIELPLFVVLFFGVALGLVIGFLWEWLREHRLRSDARSKSRELERLRREVDRLKEEKHEGQDEILAVLDKAS
jgi:uncharacterized integral membrane protein